MKIQGKFFILMLSVTSLCLRFHTYNIGTVPASCFPGGSEVKNPPTNAADACSVPGWGRSPGRGNGNPLQYSCLGKEEPGGLRSTGSQDSAMTQHLNHHLHQLSCKVFISIKWSNVFEALLSWLCWLTVQWVINASTTIFFSLFSDSSVSYILSDGQSPKECLIQY